MFLRQNKRHKNGKTHRFFAVVENRRTSGSSTERHVCIWGRSTTAGSRLGGGRWKCSRKIAGRIAS
jgi:hypothetical protein